LNENFVPNITLTGKILSGYQGWFFAPGDGVSDRWVHFGDTPGEVGFDMWPDMSECTAAERFATHFRHKDGSTACLYSANNEATVLRHFRWMREYGLDGVFLQRFVNGTRNTDGRMRLDGVLRNVRKGAAEHGRVYGLMYDLSGMRPGEAGVLIDDWKHLVDKTNLTRDDRYVRHNGKPVVPVWGPGFTDGRDPLLGDSLAMIEFLKHDPLYGGNAVMLGVPYRWRTTDTDLVPLSKMLDVINAADIVSPWAVGRPKNEDDVIRFAQTIQRGDIQWCQEHGKEYMPVVFPGFSWYNLRRGAAASNEIPRNGGQFLWTQYRQAVAAGATMIYQAMFDEVDEGTAIYKVTNDPPDGEGKSQFVTYEGLPSDFYLQLVGQAGRLLRGEMRAEDDTLVRDAAWQPFVPELPVVGPEWPDPAGCDAFE